MKFAMQNTHGNAQTSRPARGAWIEMSNFASVEAEQAVSRPARGAWIEIPESLKQYEGGKTSRPARGAWIEMAASAALARRAALVAPREGRVD